MKVYSIQIPYLSDVDKNHDMEELAERLNHVPKFPIVETPWAVYENTPIVNVSVGHTGHAILLKYFVKELEIKAIHREINQPVYKDSCVEFFIQFNNDEAYYNLEFNCLGTCLAGYGTAKENRELLPINIIEKIKVNTLISNSNDGVRYIWELSLMVPFNVFYKHEIKNLEGEECRINFFKCGDELSEPHFISWTYIQSETPNFHLPQFFGSANFLKNPEPLYT